MQYKLNNNLNKSYLITEIVYNDEELMTVASVLGNKDAKIKQRFECWISMLKTTTHLYKQASDATTPKQTLFKLKVNACAHSNDCLQFCVHVA